MSSSGPAPWMKQTSPLEERAASCASERAYALLPPRAPPSKRISRPSLRRVCSMASS
jgi:hypothetical protein